MKHLIWLVPFAAMWLMFYLVWIFLSVTTDQGFPWFGFPGVITIILGLMGPSIALAIKIEDK